MVFGNVFIKSIDGVVFMEKRIFPESVLYWHIFVCIILLWSWDSHWILQYCIYIKLFFLVKILKVRKNKRCCDKGYMLFKSILSE